MPAIPFKLNVTSVFINAFLITMAIVIYSNIVDPKPVVFAKEVEDLPMPQGWSGSQWEAEADAVFEGLSELLDKAMNEGWEDSDVEAFKNLSKRYRRLVKAFNAGIIGGDIFARVIFSIATLVSTIADIIIPPLFHINPN